MKAVLDLILVGLVGNVQAQVAGYGQCEHVLHCLTTLPQH